ncbi:MAG: hypothetical protein CM1200mP9_00590 [Gammaproteobacteria bacterium]|nr:MAG: hypothetical protein CM1200mP9_00590 [Gammaproteobacteria bacterium]
MKLYGWKISAMIGLFFWLAMIFGGMTLVFQNVVFIQWKPTIFHWGAQQSFRESTCREWSYVGMRSVDFLPSNCPSRLETSHLGMGSRLVRDGSRESLRRLPILGTNMDGV